MSQEPNIVVLHHVDSMSPQVEEGAGVYSDLVGSRKSADHPIVAGIWNILDLDEPTPSWEAGWDEIKYVVKGEAHVKDERSGKSYVLKPGSMLWIPEGAKMSLIESKDCSTIYVEQRYGQVEFGTGEPQTKNTLAGKVEQLVEKFKDRNPLSQKAYERARKMLPGGNTRAVLASDPFPLTIKGGSGCHITSADGHEYLDFVSDFSAGLFGHSNLEIQKAVETACSNGFSLGGVTEKEVELAEHIASRIPSIEKIRFCNSGTEANTFAIATATAYTRRKKILVFDGGYHGGTLGFSSRHNPLNLPHDFVFGEYNNIGKTRNLISADLAAILVEPMQASGGMIQATKEFLAYLRDSATVVGAVLIFDEVVTSRLHYHGLQGYYSVQPDLTTLGKYLGGGLPFGAFGGRSDIMNQFDPKHGGTKAPFHSGTFNNNIYTMTAALAACKQVTRDNLTQMNRRGERMKDTANQIIANAGLSSIKFTGLGSAIGIHFIGPVAEEMREHLYFFMLDKGISMGRRGFLSLNLVHEDFHVDKFLEAFGEYAQVIASELA